MNLHKTTCFPGLPDFPNTCHLN